MVKQLEELFSEPVYGDGVLGDIPIDATEKHSLSRAFADQYAKDFDESAHPRSDDGRFGNKSGDKAQAVEGGKEESKPKGNNAVTVAEDDRSDIKKVAARFPREWKYLPDTHEANLDIAEKTVDKWAASARGRLGKTRKVRDEMVKKYTDVSKRTLSKMNAKSLKRFNKFVEVIAYEPSTFDVAQVVGQATGNMRPGLAGAWIQKGNGAKLGAIVIDGPIYDEDFLGRLGWSNDDVIDHLYAHEFSHAVDGAGPVQPGMPKGESGKQLSTQPEWMDAWKTEIGGDESYLSNYAKESPQEGFAEFGRLVLMAPEKAKTYKMAYAFWQKLGIVDA